MMFSSKSFTFPVMDAPGVDPKLLEMPVLSSEAALVAAVCKLFPDTLQSADDFVATPALVPDDGSSQSSGSSPPGSPLYTPQSYAYIPLLPPNNDLDYHSSPYLAASASPEPPSTSATRVLIKAPCAGGEPIKQKGGGYSCSTCGDPFKRRDDAKRHIDSAGMRRACRYCGKPASGRRDGQSRHLLKNKTCLKKWEAGRNAGRFIVRNVEDAYY